MLGSIGDVCHRQRKRALTSLVHVCHLRPRQVSIGPDTTPGSIQTTLDFKDLIGSSQHLDGVGRAEVIMTI